MAETKTPRIFTQLSDELNRLFGAQLARLEQQLKSSNPHSSGPRKPDLAEQEAQLGLPPEDDQVGP